VKLDEKDQKRSKRLLGNLLVGTLSRTRKDHQAQAQTEQGKKRAEMEAKIAEKEKADRMAVREQRKKEYLERREAELKLRNQLAKEQSAKEFELLKLKWDQHRSNLGGFLRTKAQPPIFYRPSKAPEDMETMLEEQKKEMDAESEQLLVGARRRSNT
jgi:pinin